MTKGNSYYMKQSVDILEESADPLQTSEILDLWPHPKRKPGRQQLSSLLTKNYMKHGMIKFKGRKEGLRDRSTYAVILWGLDGKNYHRY